jgi:uncharacterized protein (TIGR03435 family)
MTQCAYRAAMKKRIYRAGRCLGIAFVVFVLLSTMMPVVRAQGPAGIAGNWQGTLDTDKPLRIVLKVSRVGDAQHGGWQGVVYLLDSGMAYEGHNSTTMSLDVGAVRLAIAPIEVQFEAKLSADGKSMTGMWTQGSGSGHLLTLTRADGDAAWEIPKADVRMAKDADPDWEVATVKPSDPEDKNGGFQWKGGRELIERKTVKDMLVLGYGMHEKQLVGVPGWAESERWDVEGLADVPGHPSLEQLQSLVRKILAERFGLKMHIEKRETGVYAITVAKGGPKLEKSAGDPNGLMSEDDHDNGGQRMVHMTNATMGELALLMKFMMERPVVDQTGLTERYDFRLTWTYDDSKVPTDGTAPPTLFTAVQEQMGLKMESIKAQTDLMVIDKLERPSAN